MLIFKGADSWPFYRLLPVQAKHYEGLISIASHRMKKENYEKVCQMENTPE